MGIFDGIETVKPTQSTPFFLPGSYRVQLIECKTTINRNREQLFIVNVKILESTNQERRPGTTAGQVIKLTGKGSESGMPNVKAFIASCLDISPSDENSLKAITSKFVEEDVIKNNSFAGLVMLLSCRLKTTKTGGTYTLHDWTLVKDEK